MSGYGLAIPCANTRITDTGAVNSPTLRQTPQVSGSVLSSSSTSDIVHPSLRPAAPSEDHNHALLRVPAFSLLCVARCVPHRQGAVRKAGCRLEVPPDP